MFMNEFEQIKPPLKGQKEEEYSSSVSKFPDNS